MPLRDRKDCTLEELVPRALAIHSSLLPSSTQRLTSSTNFLSETLWFMPTLATSDLFLLSTISTLAHIYETCKEFVVNSLYGHCYWFWGRGLASRAPDPRLLLAGPRGVGNPKGARGELQGQGRPGLPLRLRWHRWPAAPPAQHLLAPGSADHRALAGPDRDGAPFRGAHRLQTGRLGPPAPLGLLGRFEGYFHLFAVAVQVIEGHVRPGLLVGLGAGRCEEAGLQHGLYDLPDLLPRELQFPPLIQVAD